METINKINSLFVLAVSATMKATFGNNLEQLGTQHVAGLSQLMIELQTTGLDYPTAKVTCRRIMQALWNVDGDDVLDEEAWDDTLEHTGDFFNQLKAYLQDA